MHVTLKATDGDTHLVKEIKRVIRADLELRYQDNETRTLLRIATYLDPRFKSLSFLDEVEKLQVKLDMKHALVELIRKEDGAETEDNADNTRSSTAALPSGCPATKKQKLELLPEDVFDTSDSGISTPSEKAERELHTYESEVSISLQEHNPLVWWKARAPTYKYLTKLVKRTLSVTATSVLIQFCW